MNHSELSPNYTLEVPHHLRHLLLVGIFGGAIGLILILLTPADQHLVANILLVVGIIAIVLTALLTLVTNEQIRLSARRRMMNAIEWRGDEVVLDVGCGNGFLLLEVAKHLTTGKAIGIDVWKGEAGHQTTDAVRHNAQLEGVADKIDVQNVDARKLSFERGTFDVIVSSLALHHMGGDSDREQALREMIRVLKPGGIIVLYDMFTFVGQAGVLARQAGFTKVKRLG